jgi:hypothetical protein
MPHPLRSLLLAATLLAPALLLPAQSIPDQSAPAPTPRTLIERASALNKDQTAKTRYTYFMLERLEDRYDKERTIRYTGLHNLMQNIGFTKTTTLYEITWIGDLPYMRVVELQGKPLKGQALADEQARYDQAVADHSGLDMPARARIIHQTLGHSKIHIDDLLTPAYALTELRQETLAGHLTHLIDCVPVPSTDPAHPTATEHIQLWITDSGAILRNITDLIADEPEELQGSHMQVDNQLIDGTLLPQHALGHTYMLMAGENAIILADVERTCDRFRRFTVTSRILPADGQPVAPQPDPATKPSNP